MQRAIYREDENEESSASDVERQGERPQPQQAPENAALPSLESGGDRIEEILAEEFGAANYQEHHSNRETERPQYGSKFAEVRLRRRMDQSLSGAAEDNGKACNDAGGQKRQESLVETPLAFFGSPLEDLGWIECSRHAQRTHRPPGMFPLCGAAIRTSSRNLRRAARVVLHDRGTPAAACPSESRPRFGGAESGCLLHWV